MQRDGQEVIEDGKGIMDSKSWRRRRITSTVHEEYLRSTAIATTLCLSIHTSLEVRQEVRKMGLLLPSIAKATWLNCTMSVLGIIDETDRGYHAPFRITAPTIQFKHMLGL